MHLGGVGVIASWKVAGVTVKCPAHITGDPVLYTAHLTSNLAVGWGQGNSFYQGRDTETEAITKHLAGYSTTDTAGERGPTW